MESHDLMTSPVRWFKFLVPQGSQSPGKKSPDLLSNISERDLYRGLLVCGLLYNGNHVFALFPSYVDFARFNLGLSETKRCFFEIILGDRAQKPHFDIEIELDKAPHLKPEDLSSFGEELLTKFLDLMIAQFEELYMTRLNLKTDLLIFTSHGTTKRSFHVIIDNHCHTSNIEAKAFYEKITQLLPVELQPFIDSAVYSKKQQFRIVGSQKKGSGRIKQLRETWEYHGEKIEYSFREKSRNSGHKLVLLLEASLVSYVPCCRYLPNLLPVEATTKTVASSEDQEDLSPKTVEVAFNMIAKKAGVSINDPRFPYEVKGVIGTLILLKRLRPSNCQICCRIHEQENPFLLVITDDNGIRHVYLDCRRSEQYADGKKLYLGVLPEEYNGSFLPDTPCLQNANEIIAKLSRIAKIPMKEVRQIKKTAS